MMADDGPPPVAEATVPSVPADAGQIAAWVKQLGSDQFAQREAASRSLTKSGRAALEPLGDAILGDDLEVSSRGIEIVQKFLGYNAPASDAESDEAALAAAAEKLLETLADGPESPVSSLAVATLDFHAQGLTQAAREKLESLGVIINEVFLPTGRRGLQVVVRAGWRGVTEDLLLLPRLRGVVIMGLHGIRLEPAALSALGRMRGVERFELYGTGASDASVAALVQKFPEATVDVRKGGKLGVGGPAAVGPCLITQVQEGSAAAKVGVQVGDIVLHINREPVPTFDALTEKVGQRGPGETIELEIERGVPGAEGKRIKYTIELGGWE